MAGEVKRSVNLEYKADLKQLISQLEKMPGLTAKEAKKMVSVLDTNFRRAEKAAKRSQEASKKAAKAAQKAFSDVDTHEVDKKLKSAADAAGDLDSSLIAVGGAIGRLVPGFEHVAVVTADVLASFEAVTRFGGAVARIAGPIAAAMGLIAGAFFKANKELEAAEEKAEAASSKLQGLQETLEGFRERVDLIQLQTAVKLGEQSAEALELELTNQKALAAFEPGRVAVQKELFELKQKDAELSKQEAANAEARQNREHGAVQELVDLNSQRAKLDIQLAASEAKRAKIIQDQSDLALDMIQAEEHQKQLAEERKQLAQDLKAANEAQRDAAAETARIEQDRAEALQLQASVQQMVVAANEDLLSESDKIIAGADKQLDKLQEIERVTGKTADMEAARVAVIQRMNRDLAALESEKLKEADEELANIAKTMNDIPDLANGLSASLDEVADNLRMAFIDIAASLVAPFNDIFQGVMGLSTELMGATLDNLSHSQEEITDINDQIANAGSKSQVDALKEQRRIALEAIKDQKDRAMQQFKVNKSLRIAEAIMSTASAAAQALASPPGPPGTIPLAALIGAMGAVQVARIANEQPSFHQGGIVSGLQPDERSAVLRTGEGVLTSQGVAAAGGAQGVDALNRGGGGGQPMTVVFTASNRVMDSAVYDAMKSGSQLRSVTRDLRPRGRKNIYRQQARI
jgi:hypothetical protein